MCVRAHVRKLYTFHLIYILNVYLVNHVTLFTMYIKCFLKNAVKYTLKVYEIMKKLNK